MQVIVLLDPAVVAPAQGHGPRRIVRAAVAQRREYQFPLLCDPELSAYRAFGLLEGQPWAKPEVVEQLFAAKALIGERVTARYFAIELDGEVVSYADLYLDGADAQVEDVGTLPEQRGNGYATAVILGAIEQARTTGADFVFLVADAEDWPKELYGRLGFDELGHYTKFFAPPA